MEADEAFKDEVQNEFEAAGAVTVEVLANVGHGVGIDLGGHAGQELASFGIEVAEVLGECHPEFLESVAEHVVIHCVEAVVSQF